MADRTVVHEVPENSIGRANLVQRIAMTLPRIQIVTIEQALALRDRVVRLPARRGDGFKRAAREDDVRSQGALDL